MPHAAFTVRKGPAVKRWRHKVVWSAVVVVFCLPALVSPTYRDRVASLWRDQRDVREQFRRFSRTLSAGSTKDAVRASLPGYSHLRLREFQRVWAVSAPGTFRIDGWIAWLAFRADGSLVAVRYRDEDGSRIGEFPDSCLAKASECDNPCHWGQCAEGP